MSMGLTRTTTVLCAAVAMLGLLPAPGARAALGFQSVGFSIDSAPPAGSEPGAVGPPQLQAGAHPYQVDIAFVLNQLTGPQGEPVPDGSLKDLRIELPPGLTGSLNKTPQCPLEEFEAGSIFSKGCPAATQVGTVTIDSTSFDVGVPLFNLEPPPGVAARLGAFALVAPVVLDVSVRTGSDYGLTVDMRNLTQFLPVLQGSLKLWGVPADEQHDTLRGACLGLEGVSFGACPSPLPRKPFLTLPSECSGPPQVRLRANSWEHAGAFVTAAGVPRDDQGNGLGIFGCDGLDFSPSVEVQSESRTADSPSGFAVRLRFPQNENPDGRAEAILRDAQVTLPAGVSINPAAADGLGACLPAEIALNSPAEPRCPDSSRIGSVSIESPMILHPLLGSAYLATPRENAFGSMLAVYFVAERDGVLVKLAGRIDADPESGRLTVSLREIPQLPFSEMTLGFDGGPRAALATPRGCGTFTTTARLAPYSVPVGGPRATRSSSFTIDRGCDGGFSPAFAGGATSSFAGRHTGLSLGLDRAGGEVEIRSFSATLPPGLLPLLGSVPPCPEATAAVGRCRASSQIGSTAIAAGAGPHPFHLPGKVFLTDPYRGAPFGLSIVVPAMAGPFDLGTIVVRAAVSVDPADARVTIATDPLPRILRGIPLRIRGFDLTSGDRPGLFLAPTGCKARSVSATVLSTGGAIASLADPFLLVGCPGLRFSPRVSASTSARVTRAGGAALRFAVRNRSGAQANLRAIQVDFPRQLSPRLSAIQAACARSVFAAGPATCPPTSVVGRVWVRSSILDVPLSGPAYLVSRGADALPRIVLVPAARGIVLHIAGSLHIAKDGTAAVTFGSIPDAPISSLVLSLPRGPHSALGANFLGASGGSLCRHALTMPVAIVAQNGARVARSVPVSVSGCATATGAMGRKLRRRSPARCAARCDASPAARRQVAASSR